MTATRLSIMSQGSLTILSETFGHACAQPDLTWSSCVAAEFEAQRARVSLLIRRVHLRYSVSLADGLRRGMLGLQHPSLALDGGWILRGVVLLSSSVAGCLKIMVAICRWQQSKVSRYN